MTAQACPACGAPIAPGAQFCSYCGRPASYVSSGPAPLPSGALGGAASPAAPAASIPTWANPPPRRRPRWLVVVAVVVVALLLVGVAGYYLADTTPTSIQVTEMDVYAPDNVCGLNSHRIAYYGFNDTANDHLPIQLPVENFNTTACTIRDVSTDTSGFAVQNVETNDTIAGGQSGTLSLTLALPGGAFTGPVDLIFR